MGHECKPKISSSRSTKLSQTQSNSVEFLDIMRGVKKSNIFTVLSFKKDIGDSQ